MADASTPPEAGTIRKSEDPSPWSDETKRKFKSKERSEYLDPCQTAASRSIKCLHRNGGDRSMCGEYFQAYRDCKKAWMDKLKEDRKKASVW